MILYVFKDEQMIKKQVRGTDYWITITMNSPLIRLDFAPIYAGNTIKLCSKGDTLEPGFMSVTNFHPLKDFEKTEKEIFKDVNLHQSFNSQGQEVKVYKVFMSGQFCKCAYRDTDGTIIPLYIPLDNLKVETDKEKRNFTDLSQFNFHFFRQTD